MAAVAATKGPRGETKCNDVQPAPPVRLHFIAAGKILLAALRSNLPAASEAQLSGAVQVWAFRPK
jgi:hypothetical protein